MTRRFGYVRDALAEATSELLLACPDVNAVGMTAMVREWVDGNVVSPDITTVIEAALDRAAGPSAGSNAAGVRMLVLAALDGDAQAGRRVTQRAAQP